MKRPSARTSHVTEEETGQEREEGKEESVRLRTSFVLARILDVRAGAGELGFNAAALQKRKLELTPLVHKLVSERAEI